MKNTVLIPALVSATVTLAFVIINYLLQSRFDRIRRQREQNVAYMVAVFRTFSKASNHPKLYEIADELEQAIADIQLFGSKRQIDLMKHFAEGLSGPKQDGEMTDLLIDLRDGLRVELDAPPVEGRVLWFKISRP